MSNKSIVLIVIVGILVLFVGMPVVFGSWFTVSPGQKALVLRFGQITQVVDNGFQFKMPYLDSVVKIDTQTQKEQTDAEAASSDLQTVHTRVAVNYSVDGTKVKELYSTIGEEYKTKIIDPAIQEAVKATTANYTAEQLITKRPEVQDGIKAQLVARLAPQFITVSSVSIINFDFSPSFNSAIEAKVTAEQNALAAKNKLEQIKFEAEQTVASAKAEAESISLKSQAANNEKYVSLKALEVQLEFAKKWNGQLPVNLYGSAPIPFLQLSK